MIILFDLYDTILQEVSFDFEKGLEFLYRTAFHSSCTLEALKAYSKTLLPLYDAREATHQEVCFIRDEYPLLCEKFQISPEKDLSSLDYAVMMSMLDTALADETRETIRRLFDLRVPMYILSNSIFLASSHKRLLNEYGIRPYFLELFSSADFGIQKPDTRFFDYAVDQVYQDYPGITKEDIFFIGNDYNADIIGSQAAGLKSIWYNKKREPNSHQFDIWDITDFREILKIVFP